MYRAEFLALLPLLPAGVTGVHHHAGYPYFITLGNNKNSPGRDREISGFLQLLNVVALFGAKPDLKVPGMDIILISFLI